VDGRRILSGLWRFLVAAIAAMIAGAGFLIILGGVAPGAFPVSGFLAAIISIAVVGIVMLIVYFGILVLLGSDDLQAGLAPLLTRLTRASEHRGDKE
jgi:putative peptidoglycan lipid II flippase